MPDTINNASTLQHSSTLPEIAAQSPDAHRPNGVRPSGLPLFSTERMTAAEAAGLNRLAQAHREQADRLEQAMQRGTVTAALATVMVGVRLGQIEAEFSRLLGSNR